MGERPAAGVYRQDAKFDKNAARFKGGIFRKAKTYMQVILRIYICRKGFRQKNANRACPFGRFFAHGLTTPIKRTHAKHLSPTE